MVRFFSGLPLTVGAGRRQHDFVEHHVVGEHGSLRQHHRCQRHHPDRRARHQRGREGVQHHRGGRAAGQQASFFSSVVPKRKALMAKVCGLGLWWNQEVL